MSNLSEYYLAYGTFAVLHWYLIMLLRGNGRSELAIDEESAGSIQRSPPFETLNHTLSPQYHLPSGRD